MCFEATSRVLIPGAVCNSGSAVDIILPRDAGIAHIMAAHGVYASNVRRRYLLLPTFEAPEASKPLDSEHEQGWWIPPVSIQMAGAWQLEAAASLTICNADSSMSKDSILCKRGAKSMLKMMHENSTSAKFQPALPYRADASAIHKAVTGVEHLTSAGACCQSV